MSHRKYFEDEMGESRPRSIIYTFLAFSTTILTLPNPILLNILLYFLYSIVPLPMFAVEKHAGIFFCLVKCAFSLVLAQARPVRMPQRIKYNCIVQFGRDTSTISTKATA